VPNGAGLLLQQRRAALPTQCFLPALLVWHRSCRTPAAQQQQQQQQLCRSLLSNVMMLVECDALSKVMMLLSKVIMLLSHVLSM
jgi:hypothetical protein